MQVYRFLYYLSEILYFEERIRDTIAMLNRMIWSHIYDITLHFRQTWMKIDGTALINILQVHKRDVL